MAGCGVVPKVTVSHRVDEDLLAWAGQYAKKRGTTRSVLLEEALVAFRDLSRGGVPDLPSPSELDRAVPKIKPAPVMRARRLLEKSPEDLARQGRVNRLGRS
jgi:hypothetical protein